MAIETGRYGYAGNHTGHHTLIYDAMSSMTYLTVVIATVFFLTLCLLIIILSWCCWWLRVSRGKYEQRTVHYSPLNSEDEDIHRKKFGRTYQSTRRLMFSDYHRSVPSQTVHTQTRITRQWINVPPSVHIDINAGHLLLDYIEVNKDRFDKEWESLMGYYPEDVTRDSGQALTNKHKNRYPDILPYDHCRVKLEKTNNVTESDYINASYIVDTDPSCPKYIATQSPMQHTISDFWQMIWEQNIAVIVMLTALSEGGITQSYQYWPSNGVSTYHHFEVRLVSEHHHTNDYIVRSFFIVNLKNMMSRTITQFHFLTWSPSVTPISATPLLEFRRKIISAHTGLGNIPLLVHCSDGVGRTGTYILIDMTLSRICSGAKEINLAATIEHLRDQRCQMVKSKQQFDFALIALVEETQNMLNESH